MCLRPICLTLYQAIPEVESLTTFPERLALVLNSDLVRKLRTIDDVSSTGPVTRTMQ